MGVTIWFLSVSCFQRKRSNCTEWGGRQSNWQSPKIMVPRHKLKGEKPFSEPSRILEQTTNVNLKHTQSISKLCKLYQQEEECRSLLKPAESVLRPHTKVLSCIILVNKLLTHIAIKRRLEIWSFSIAPLHGMIFEYCSLMVGLSLNNYYL